MKIFALALLLAAILIPASHAKADPCIGTWTIGIGGVTPQVVDDSSYLSADYHVVHNSLDPANGVQQLDHAFWWHRNQCRADHIKILAHSEGSWVADLWEHAHQSVSRTSVVLLAHPGGIYVPDAGIPTLSVCRVNDVVCNPQHTDVSGYLFKAAHTSYDFDSADYSNDARGTIWLDATG